MQFSMYEIIKKKRDGGELNRDELAYVVRGACQHRLPEAQLAAWLMAVFWRGLSRRETVDLTVLMAQSGSQLDLSRLPGVKVDKHSTGGVGDKTTLVVAPLVAAAGLPVAKLSGRALGHTGGTLDKLESIPGFRTDLSMDEFIGQVERIGVAVAGAGAGLAPADKVFYALRDQTATVDSIPLIAASVLSKKLAAGADAFVLDVKVGSGAFLKREEEAVTLAETMVETARGAGRRARALVTDMNQPLGRAVGNAVEVEEAVAVLRGEGPAAVRELSLELGTEMLLLAGVEPSRESARRRLLERLASGAALEKFQIWVQAQGGDPHVAERPQEVLPRPSCRRPLLAGRTGFVQGINGEEIGLALAGMGAGRTGADAVIDPAAGLLVEVSIGDEVEAGRSVLGWVQGAEASRVERAIPRLLGAFRIGPEPVSAPPLVYRRVG